MGNPFDQNVISNTVSTFIPSQFPEFIREQSPAFIQFLQAYFEFLETADFGPNTNSVIYNAKNLLTYKDVDTTSDAFIQYFINDFLPYFPNKVALDERKLIKIARQFYTQKGTPQSIQLLFQVLYNKTADIYYPKNNILRLSDGKWTLPQAVRLLLSADNYGFPVQQLVGCLGVGSNSGAQCVIESVNKTVDPNLGFEIVEVYISNLTRPFNDLENLVVTYDTNGDVFQEKIIAAISNIVVDPHNQGLLYNTGDPVVITGGLEPNDQQAQKAIAYVGNVSTGSVVSLNVVFGGYNYRQDPNTVVSFVNAPGADGSGAMANVTAIDTPNTKYLLVNTDCIDYKAQAVIGGSGWGFAANVNANANCKFQNAFSYSNLSFAPLVALEVTAGGGGYKKVPTVAFEVTYYTDLCNDLATADSPALQAAIQNIDDLGIFAAVQILANGTGYSTVKDKIYCNTAIGYAANFTFTTNATGSITGITIVNPGCGYIDIPNTGLYLANSTNAQVASNGTGALLMGYGYGQGANVTVGVDQIGQIIDFNLVNRGFDYVATPNVSLRIQDMVIQPLSENQIPYPDATIYQGANYATATYRAYVDSYNITDNVLRLYNYSGSLSAYQNLVMTLTTGATINVMINTSAVIDITTYGNGQAKANAIFLNGLIQYPGFYLSTDGFLSADQYIQDSNTYHNFSYQIIVEKALAEYKSVLMKIAHPAGMSMLGTYIIPAHGMVQPNTTSNVSFISPLTGNVTPNATYANLIGHSTTFAVDNILVGDMIVISDGLHASQSKLITAVVSNTSLNLESNTRFTFAYVNIANNSNVVWTSNNTGILAANDVVTINISGNIVTRTIQTTNGGSFNVATNYGQNANGILMSVQPAIVNASYQIIQANVL